MKVKLLVDLTTYDPVFTEGKVCVTDGVPVIHPNVKWQNCYVLKADGHSLMVGEGSIKWLDKNDCSGITEGDLKNMAVYTEGKLQLAELLSPAKCVLMKMDKHERIYHFSFYEVDKRTNSIAEIDTTPMAAFNEQWLRIYGEFLKEYLDEEKDINYLCLKPQCPYNVPLEEVRERTNARSIFLTTRVGGHMAANAIDKNAADQSIGRIVAKIVRTNFN